LLAWNGTNYLIIEASMENKEVRQLISELVEEGGKFTFLGNYTEI